MKIPFTLDAWLKDKSQKVETRSGVPARIVCWDRKTKDMEILALVEDEHIDCTEEAIAEVAASNGRVFPRGKDHDYDLFLVTPEPEMSEFELALDDTIRSYRCDSEKDEDGGILDYQSWIKRKATSLLALAKQQLLQSGELMTQEHHEKLMETLREECKKDLPRWRNVEADKRYVGCVTRYMDVNGDWNYCLSSGKLSDDCQYISIAALEKLPKENEK